MHFYNLSPKLSTAKMMVCPEITFELNAAEVENVELPFNEGLLVPLRVCPCIPLCRHVLHVTDQDEVPDSCRAAPPSRHLGLASDESRDLVPLKV